MDHGVAAVAPLVDIPCRREDAPGPTGVRGHPGLGHRCGGGLAQRCLGLQPGFEQGHGEQVVAAGNRVDHGTGKLGGLGLAGVPEAGHGERAEVPTQAVGQTLVERPPLFQHAPCQGDGEFLGNESDGQAHRHVHRGFGIAWLVRRWGLLR